MYDAPTYRGGFLIHVCTLSQLGYLACAGTCRTLHQSAWTGRLAAIERRDVPRGVVGKRKTSIASLERDPHRL